MTDPAISRVLLADHHLPAPVQVGHVEVRLITLPADAASGPHEHNGPVFGVILEGSVRFRVAGGPDTLLHAGDQFTEPAWTLIDAFDATEEGARFMAWFPLPEGVAGELTPR